MTDFMPIDPDIHAEATHARLEQLHRFAQVGRCVNGVTHDMNNALGAILAYAELIALDEALSNDSQRITGDIINSVNKCTELVARITDIARDEKPSVSIIDPGTIVKRALLMRSYSLRAAKIKVETDIQDGLPSFGADIPKLQLAIIYLLFNAQEALENHTPKLIRIRTYQKGESFYIEIWNSGPGLGEIRHEDLSTPYKTTKSGFHWGLSLPAAQRYIALHNGALSCNAERGFVIELPVQTGI